VTTACGGPISVVTESTTDITHATALRVADVLRSNGARGPFREFVASTKTARDAADALGCDVGAIASSLVLVGDRGPVVLLKSGAFRADLDLLARLLTVSTVRMATADEVRTATGQAIGGVSPAGWPNELPVFIDTALAEYEAVWAACGTPNAVFATTYDELISLTGATPVVLR